MARRAKPAAEPVVSLAPPPSPHPPGGYDARTVAEAAEIIRHQSDVLEIRGRVATAAGGLRPLRAEAAAPLPVARLGLEAREAELAVATAALRDAETTLTRTRDELAVREARVAEREARVLQDKQALADASVELDRDRRALSVREEELAQHDAALRTETAAARSTLHEIDQARAELEAKTSLLDERASALSAAEAKLLAECAAELESGRHREQTLAMRTASLEQLEKDVARRHAEVAGRERVLSDLQKRERSLAGEAKRLERSKQTAAERAAKLERLEKELARRHAEMSARERELGKREARLEKDRAAELRRDAKEQKRVEQKPAVEPAADTLEQPEAVVAASIAQPTGAGFNVETLAALVEQRGHEFPEHVDEWHWTLVSLRDVADIGGVLPRTVDGLVRDVFEPLLD
jgi:chromosome segregation ATPase